MKNLRKILWPFAVPYDGITRLRNYFYDNQLFESKSYDFPVIGIGNLSTGGTGKSPMTEYLISLLKDAHNVAVLSRGYGRKTKGYLDVNSTLEAIQTGDEPLQFARKFNDIQVAVSENRVEGIKRLKEKELSPQVLILDDIYQHRKVKPGFLILLTAYGDFFYDDLILPAGNLRESKYGADRAHCVIVTKCPFDLSIENQNKIRNKISKYTKAPVYFSSIAYGELHSISGIEDWKTISQKDLAVVTGIAKPKPFLNYFDTKKIVYKHIQFSDHHNFSEEEIKKLDDTEIVLTTEKDFVRLNGKLKNARLFYIPIKFQFLTEGLKFNKMIFDFVASDLFKE